MQLSIVVPVYKSADCLEELARRVRDAVDGGFDGYELILVNDASPDRSWQIIERLVGEHDFVVGINLRKNAGQDGALMAGLREARGAAIVIMDDDLQHDPADIPALTAPLADGFDVVYAVFHHKEQALWKNLGSWFNGRVATWLLKKPASTYMSPYKAVRREVVDEIVKYDGPFPYVDGLIFTITDNCAEVPATHHRRFAGAGNFTMRRSLAVWLRLATSFSVIPLRLVSLAGAILALFAFLAGAYFLAEAAIEGRTVEGWLSLIVGVFFLGGIQLIGIGAVGEYVARLYLTINKRPQFLIKEIRRRGDGLAENALDGANDV